MIEKKKLRCDNLETDFFIIKIKNLFFWQTINKKTEFGTIPIPFYSIVDVDRFIYQFFSSKKVTIIRKF